MAATPILGFCTCMMALVTAICALSAALTHHWVVVESGGGEGTNGVSNQTFYWGLSHECFDSTCTQLEYTPVATCTRSSADVEERYDVVLGFIVVGFLFAFFTGGLSIFASFRIKSQEHRRSIARGEIEGVTMALSKLKQLREAEEVLSKRIIGIAILSGLSLLSFIVGMILFADATNSYTFCQNACDHFRSVMVGVTSCGYGSSYLLGVAATICSVVMFIFGIIFFGIYKSGESTRWNGVADFSDLEKTRTPYGDEVRSLGSMRSGRKSRRPKRRSPAPEATPRSTPQPSSSENAKQRGLPPAAASENTEAKKDSREEEEKEDPPALKYQLTTYSAVGDGEDQQQQQSNGNRQKTPQPYEEKREQEEREERKKKEEEEQRRKEDEDERQRRRRDAEAQRSRDEEAQRQERAKEEERREAKRQDEEKRRKEEDERIRKDEERRIEEDNARRRREEAEEAARKQATMKEESPQPSPERNQPQPTQQQTPPPAAAANSSYNPLDRTQSSAAGSPAGAGNNNNKILPEHRGIIENLQGNDWCWSADHELYWSDEEKLFFDPESCNFYDPDKEQWYDPESGEWYTLDE